MSSTPPVLSDAQARVQALLDAIGPHAQVGFHGHQNLSLGVANSVLAVQGGARQIDGALCALGAGAGNAPTEVLAATFDRLGIGTGVDVQGVLAAAQEVLRPILPRMPFADRSAIVQGYAGVYSSFLLHAERASERYSVAAHEILGTPAVVGMTAEFSVVALISAHNEADVIEQVVSDLRSSLYAMGLLVLSSPVYLLIKRKASPSS